MKKTILALAAAAVTLTGLASAADAAPLKQRETRIEQRIDQGARTGRLTRREATNLRLRVASIRRVQQVQRHRGMRMAERRKLDHRLDKLSTRVRFEKHHRDFRG
jgi:hypothetical protein